MAEHVDGSLRLALPAVEVGMAAVAVCCLAAFGLDLLLVELHAAGTRAAPQDDHLLVAFGAILFLLSSATVYFGWTAVRQRNAWQAERRDFVAAQQSGFDSASDAIVVLDANGRIETLNKAAERVFGRSRDALEGRDVAPLLDLAISSGPLEERLEVTTEDLDVGIRRELSGRRGDSEAFPVNVTFRRLLQPGGPRILGFVRDISERKRVERLKDEFVSTVNHELRTPLTSIAGSLGLLVGGAGGELPAGAARLIAIAHANCQRLIRLINDMLDVEKIESGKMRFEMVPLRLAEIARRAIESLQGYADQLNVEMAFRAEDEDIELRADADRLVQVLTDLISNALKFSAVGGCVQISVERAARLARFCVKDDGPGIPDEFRSRIFTKFAQADSSDTRQKGGTGLGLVIAKEIVERHGGRLWFESQAGKGARFFADLPLCEEHSADRDGNAGKTILVCEDDPDVAEVLSQALARDGFDVAHVTNKRDALLALGQGRHHALILDLVLPDGDGVELIREARKREETRTLPIIVVSAEAERGRNGVGSNVLDVVDWMDKPVDLMRLRATVQRVVASAEAVSPVILHVEDDTDILQLVASALKGCGEIVSAESLSAARAALSQRRPDLVVLDLALGDGSGLELLPELRDERGSPIPVLVFSARDADQRVLRQVHAVMTKSKTSLPELANMVRNLLDDRPQDIAPRQKIAI